MADPLPPFLLRFRASFLVEEDVHVTRSSWKEGNQERVEFTDGYLHGERRMNRWLTKLIINNDYF